MGWVPKQNNHTFPDGTVLRRKGGWYTPCAMGPKLEALEKQAKETGDWKAYAQLLKSTYWADNYTDAEWPCVLEDTTEKSETPVPSYVRSRLKKKAAGWIVALGRMAAVNPDLFEEVMEKAVVMYKEQTEKDYPATQFILKSPSFRMLWWKDVAAFCSDLFVSGISNWSAAQRRDVEPSTYAADPLQPGVDGCADGQGEV